MAVIPLIHSPIYDLNLPDTHKVSGRKFSALYSEITSGAMSTRFEPHSHWPATVKDLTLSHDSDYVARFQNNLMTRAEMNRINLPWSVQLLERSFLMPNGTLHCAKLAIEKKNSVSHRRGRPSCTPSVRIRFLRVQRPCLYGKTANATADCGSGFDTGL